jgi:hypothetical protein
MVDKKYLFYIGFFVCFMLGLGLSYLAYNTPLGKSALIDDIQINKHILGNIFLICDDTVSYSIINDAIYCYKDGELITNNTNPLPP